MAFIRTAGFLPLIVLLLMAWIHPAAAQRHGAWHHRGSHGIGHGFGRGMYRYPSWYRSYSYRAFPSVGFSIGVRYPEPWGIAYAPGTGQLSYYLPPIHAPAELNYGPQAMKQFMGVPRDFAMGPLAQPQGAPADPAPAIEPRVRVFPGLDDAEAGEGDLAPGDAEELPPPGADARDGSGRGAGRDGLELAGVDVRESSLESRVRAAKYVGYGDARFLAQKPYEALQRYKTASFWAPDEAAPFLRRAFALIAIGRYDDAFTAVDRTVRLERDYIRNTKFRLDAVYGDSNMLKNGHLETLSKAAWDNPGDGQAYFLIGVFLHFDHQADRAIKFFQQAKKLGIHPTLIAAFDEVPADHEPLGDTATEDDRWPL